MPTKKQLEILKKRSQRSPEEALLADVDPYVRSQDAEIVDAEELKRREIERIRAHVADCIAAGREYRDRFMPIWEEIENQVRQVPPESWSKKEDWQTKVYIGLQAKTSETAFANMMAMLFPTDRFFQVSGVERRDREQEGALEELFQGLLTRGGFYEQKDYLVEEGIDIGTGFLKLMAKPDKTGIDYLWRSPMQCLVDQSARHDFGRSKFWIDQIEKDLSFVNEEIRKGSTGSIYDPELLKGALDAIASKGAGLNKDTEISRIRNIDGTGDLVIPKGYKTITLNEFWGLMPMPVDPEQPDGEYALKWMVVTLINDEFVIRADENPYGGIPAIPLKIKPYKYEAYGKGYLLNGRGTQDLTNSMVNLAFDSMKICSMDIIILDENAISDHDSIEYKPLAVWKVKGDPSAAVRMTRQGISAMQDTMNGIALMDRTHQDVTGVTRHAEGSPTVDGKQGEQTLGEYQLKLQAVDKRFLSVAKRVEQSFTKDLLRKTFQIIRNPMLFSQEAADRYLGKKQMQIIDPISMAPAVVEIPKLYLKALGEEMDWDFRGTGVSQFSERQRTLEKLQIALQAAMSNPTLAAMTNIDVLWKRIFQVSEIPDWEEIIKSPEQMQEMMNFLQTMGSGVPAEGEPMSGVGAPQNIPTRGAAA